MSGQPPIREPIEQLGLQARGFLDSLNAALELSRGRGGLSEEERRVIGVNLPPLATTISMVYEAVIGEPMPDAFPEEPVIGLMLEPGGRVISLHFQGGADDEIFRELIGGDLEMVRMPPVAGYEYGLACFVDADGIEKDLPENPRAAELFPGLSKILGPMIICGWDRKEDLLLDCPKPILELLGES